MKNKIVHARIEAEDLQVLRSVCQARSEGISGFVRRAIRKELACLSYLSDYEKKALGIRRDSSE